MLDSAIELLRSYIWPRESSFSEPAARAALDPFPIDADEVFFRDIQYQNMTFRREKIQVLILWSSQDSWSITW